MSQGGVSERIVFLRRRIAALEADGGPAPAPSRGRGGGTTASRRLFDHCRARPRRDRAGAADRRRRGGRLRLRPRAALRPACGRRRGSSGSPRTWSRARSACPMGAGCRRRASTPERLVLARTRRPRETLWAMEEALRSRAGVGRRRELGLRRAPMTSPPRGAWSLAARRGGSPACCCCRAPPARRSGSPAPPRSRFEIAASFAPQRGRRRARRGRRCPARSPFACASPRRAASSAPSIRRPGATSSSTMRRPSSVMRCLAVFLPRLPTDRILRRRRERSPMTDAPLAALRQDQGRRAPDRRRRARRDGRARPRHGGRRRPRHAPGAAARRGRSCGRRRAAGGASPIGAGASRRSPRPIRPTDRHGCDRRRASVRRRGRPAGRGRAPPRRARVSPREGRSRRGPALARALARVPPRPRRAMCRRRRRRRRSRRSPRACRSPRCASTRTARRRLERAGLRSARRSPVAAARAARRALRGRGHGAARRLAGRRREPISPRFEAPDFMAERRFPEGLTRQEDIERTLAASGARALPAARAARRRRARMSTADLLPRRRRRRAYRDGNQPAAARSRAARSAAARTPRRPRRGGARHRLWLRCDAARRDADRALRDAAGRSRPRPARPSGDGADLADLVDRLGARLGLRRVLRLYPQAAHLPEFAVAALPAAAPPPRPEGAAPPSSPAQRRRRRAPCVCSSGRSRSRPSRSCPTGRRCGFAGGARCTSSPPLRGRSASPRNGGARPDGRPDARLFLCGGPRRACASGCSAKALIGRECAASALVRAWLVLTWPF